MRLLIMIDRERYSFLYLWQTLVFSIVPEIHIFCLVRPVYCHPIPLLFLIGDSPREPSGHLSLINSLSKHSRGSLPSWSFSGWSTPSYRDLSRKNGCGCYCFNLYYFKDMERTREFLLSIKMAEAVIRRKLLNCCILNLQKLESETKC